MLAGLFRSGFPVSYTIYGDLRSGAFSSEAVLAEVGAEYKFERISLEKNEQKEPAFLAINPSGKMPALRLPEGAIVTESLAILLTIADHFPNARLLPPGGSIQRAEAFRWLAFMSGEIYPLVELSDYPERFAPKGGESDALREKVRERLRKNLLTVERNFKGPWFMGEAFSIVDIYAVMFTRWRGTFGKDWLPANLPDLFSLADRLSKRERIAPVWQRQWG
jgi:glutathione S-transferase